MSPGRDCGCSNAARKCKRLEDIVDLPLTGYNFSRYYLAGLIQQKFKSFEFVSDDPVMRMDWYASIGSPSPLFLATSELYSVRANPATGGYLVAGGSLIRPEDISVGFVQAYDRFNRIIWDSLVLADPQDPQTFLLPLDTHGIWFLTDQLIIGVGGRQSNPNRRFWIYNAQTGEQILPADGGPTSGFSENFERVFDAIPSAPTDEYFLSTGHPSFFFSYGLSTYEENWSKDVGTGIAHKMFYATDAKLYGIYTPLATLPTNPDTDPIDVLLSEFDPANGDILSTQTIVGPQVSHPRGARSVLVDSDDSIYMMCVPPFGNFPDAGLYKFDFATLTQQWFVPFPVNGAINGETLNEYVDGPQIHFDPIDNTKIWLSRLNGGIADNGFDGSGGVNDAYELWQFDKLTGAKTFMRISAPWLNPISAMAFYRSYESAHLTMVEDPFDGGKIAYVGHRGMANVPDRV